ncbi:MAG TPA: PQQ-dependent sugar dehydrogenase [Gemmataceae bacterium]|nr:PQQ-dependent sugar dehydrogenase [Gemmataceae bacterium]
MKTLSIAVLLLCGRAFAGDAPPRDLIEGLKNPAAVVVGQGGKVFVAVPGRPATNDDAAVLLIQNGKAVPFASGLDGAHGMAAYQQWIFVAGRKHVWRIDKTGMADILAPPNAFPADPVSLIDVACDQESGMVYVSDRGDADGKGAAVYRITPLGPVSVLVDPKHVPGLSRPGALAMDGASHLLAADIATGDLYRIKLADGSAEKVAGGLGAVSGLAWDHYGRLFISDNDGRILVIPHPGDKPAVVTEKSPSPGRLCLDPTGKQLLVPDRNAGTVTAVPAVVPGAEVDETPLAVRTEVAFPDLQWAGWKGETDDGKPNALRPIVLTHAGDGSNRVFVATEQGVVHVFPNDQKATKTKVFLDISGRVSYEDKKMEEGFLGLVFHPNYKENGEFFVFYTARNATLTNVLSRFHVSKDDPDRADPDSEEVLLRIRKPYWNHDGGVLCFGSDGFLYFSHGDGGAGNDLYDNGQRLDTLLGKVLRIDVDHKDPGKNYAIPKDNPFVDRLGARPEIWAYGLRNVWRMAFDRPTGRLWAADVGQNLFEEIDFIQKGANYGWNRREGLHPFGARGMGPRPDFIEPIWEYDHDVGKSIIGGCVYHGSRLPELDGCYIYGDYVTTKIWALRYDDAKGRVVANRPILDRAKAIFSFGEDEKGEVYLLTPALDGKGVYWFVK